ncbi:hypothetical protein [Pectobacterium sp. PL152]|uniref:hypothetical protein n=1 Tax=Pectobacterium sp. PL152 TaxID=2859229 RepID=UPI003D7E86FA
MLYPKTSEDIVDARLRRRNRGKCTLILSPIEISVLSLNSQCKECASRRKANHRKIQSQQYSTAESKRQTQRQKGKHLNSTLLTPKGNAKVQRLDPRIKAKEN